MHAVIRFKTMMVTDYLEKMVCPENLDKQVVVSMVKSCLIQKDSAQEFYKLMSEVVMAEMAKMVVVGLMVVMAKMLRNNLSVIDTLLI